MSEVKGHALALRGLTKRYGEFVAVADVSLEVGRGEFLWHVGGLLNVADGSMLYSIARSGVHRLVDGLQVSPRRPGRSSIGEPIRQWARSFGWIGFFDPITPPAISMARLLITSLTFMLDWVPDPVCHTTSGKWSRSLPAITSSAAATIRSRVFSSMRPSLLLASAAAFLSTPKAVMISTGIFSPPMSKLASDRAVCAP